MTYTFDEYQKEVFERNPKIKELCEQEMINYLVAQRIKKTREFKGISQLELAKLANTSQSVVARIEAGNQNLSLNTLHKFLKILGLELKIEESPLSQG
ncbi:MAG: helix-turn-helix transcriptional regulator [Candidatus Gracilibacteria bacterium]|nr:helix-turn-helix transcriptional regulator [Candidatus Gracilibacteria bacterium]